MILISATSDLISQLSLPSPTFFTALYSSVTINTEIIARKVGGRKIKATQPCDDVPHRRGSTDDDMKAGTEVWKEYEYFSSIKQSLAPLMS